MKNKIKGVGIKSIEVVSFVTPKQLLESFRIEEDNEYEYEIKLKVFARVLEKDTTESFTLLFFSPKKLVRLFILKEVNPSPDSKIIQLLTFDNLFPSLRQSR